MNVLRKIYFHIEGTQNADNNEMGSVKQNYVVAEVYYDKGGYSYFTYKNTPRAYWMSVHKIGRGKDSCGYWESHTIFDNSGVKRLLFEVGRQSKKKDAEALDIFEKDIKEFVEKIYPDLILTQEDAA